LASLQKYQTPYFRFRKILLPSLYPSIKYSNPTPISKILLLRSYQKTVHSPEAYCLEYSVFLFSGRFSELLVFSGLLYITTRFLRSTFFYATATAYPLRIPVPLRSCKRLFTVYFTDFIGILK